MATHSQQETVKKMATHGIIDSGKVDDKEGFAGYMSSYFNPHTNVLELHFEPFATSNYPSITARFLCTEIIPQGEMEQ